MQLPVLKNVRLDVSNYVGFQFYFVTLCCFRRETIFLDPAVCQEILGILRAECAARGFAAHAYCAMPDHLHFLCQGLQGESDFRRLMTSFRIKSSRSFAASHGRALWQRSYYEHILRRREDPKSVAWYIWMNPVRKKLVGKVEEYPFAGSFTTWKMPRSWSGEDWRPPGKLEGEA